MSKDEGLGDLLKEIERARRGLGTPGSQEPPGQPYGEQYPKFLEYLAKGIHPPFAELTWNGEYFQIRLKVKFQEFAGQDPDIVRQRAYKYFSRFSPSERKILEIEVVVQGGVPTHAFIKTRPGVISDVFRLGTTRLRELQNPD